MNAAERTGPRLATAARCPHGVDDESVCHEKNLRLFASWEYPARRWPPQGNAILNSAGAKPQPEKTCRSWQNRSRSATETSSHVTNRRNRRELPIRASGRGVLEARMTTESREFFLVG